VLLDNSLHFHGAVMGYGVFLLPLKYFGLSLGAFYKAKSIWNVVIEKIVHWLAS
jgi:hypothetical protein